MSVVRVRFYQDGREWKQLGRQLFHLEIQREINRIPFAQLVLGDGDPALRRFPLSDQPGLIPGKELTIELGYEGGGPVAPVFRGLIARHAVEAESQGLEAGSRLILDLYARALTMTIRAQSRVFREMTDTQIFKQLIEENGLKAGQIADTQPVHREMVQYQCSDWDFLIARAEANGLWVMVRLDEQGEEWIDVAPPGEVSDSFRTFTFGGSKPSIYSLEFAADGVGQMSEVQSRAWNSRNQEMTRPAGAANSVSTPGDLDPGAIAASLGADVAILSAAAETREEELEAWASATLQKSRQSLIRGRLGLEGSHEYQLNQCIEIAGVGDHFNGRTLITGLGHSLDALTGWRTDIQFGLSAEWHARKYQLQSSPAAALLPAINGLHIGTVTEYDTDRENKLLVNVRVPVMGQGEDLIRARLAMPYAGRNHGLFFRPEVGDEVVLGFFDDDPRHAVVLGALYSETNFPPVENDQIDSENQTKIWAGRQGIRMIWDEKGPALQLLTQETDDRKMQLLLGKDKIEISDLNGNLITMNSKGITIKSKTAVTIVAPKVDVN